MAHLSCLTVRALTHAYCDVPLQGKSMMHFTTMGFPDEGGNAAQRIAWTGWSFFILIVISAYTANLAAFLVRKPSTTIGVSRASALLFDGPVDLKPSMRCCL